MSANKMTDAQVGLIRDLRKEVLHLLSKEKDESLVAKMKAHISEEKVQTTVWANQVIQILKGLKTKENLRIAQERRAANLKK